MISGRPFVARMLCSLMFMHGAGMLAGSDRALALQPSTAAHRPIMPAEPISAILAASGSHDIVALDEGRHGNEQGHELRLKLVRHPSFARTVNDIVVEFGNARYRG
jgi:hypothetical protein